MIIGILPNVSFISQNRFRTRRLRNNQLKKLKKCGDKNAVAILQDVRQLGCALQDIEPLESSSILRKDPKGLGPIRRVRFTKAALRQANIRENKGPSLNKIHVEVLISAVRTL